ncbi:NADH-cytochrome b5 reductase 1 [Armadillidium vulgare]|nr:NADH-cytochrome b5 reductase 1 [Armadillidium vulgare]
MYVQIYSKNVHPKYPEGGKMSQHLDSLKLGDCIDVRGPTGSMEYQGEGVFSIKRDKKSSADTILAKKLNMIAGGTGITPILQLIRDIVRNPKDKTEMRLIFANQTEEDILLRQELEEVANSYPDRFKLWYTISTANEDMISHHMFPPSNDTLVLMCGPPAMIKNACIPNLDKLKYSANMRKICYKEKR